MGRNALGSNRPAMNRRKRLVRPIVVIVAFHLLLYISYSRHVTLLAWVDRTPDFLASTIQDNSDNAPARPSPVGNDISPHTPLRAPPDVFNDGKKEDKDIDGPISSSLSPLRVGNSTLLADSPRYIAAIMDPSNTNLSRLSCPPPASGRYDYLRQSVAGSINPSWKPKYFFALNLRQCVDILPSLIGSIVETIRFLGPYNCVLSIVEGLSDDGTYEVLKQIHNEMELLGVKYYFDSSEINTKSGGDERRIALLAELRNLALRPLLESPHLYDPDTTVFFINDVSLCMEDILELLHQRVRQHADMTCAMDWIVDGTQFYDVWVSRTMQGHQFFEVPQSITWEFSKNLFWNDPKTRARYEARLPFQVWSCWNGATSFTAKPLLEGKVRFRSHYPGECLMGEPTHFCKDFWHHGYGKIAVVPSVNVGYSDEQSAAVKRLQRYTAENVLGEPKENLPTMIDWQAKPPDLIKCVQSYFDYQHPTWVKFDEGLEPPDPSLTKS